MTDTTETPAGWYPDPHGANGARWWDGTQWTDQALPLAPVAPAAPPKAPEGTNTNTVWIWLNAVVPILGLSTLFLIDFGGYMQAVMQNPTSPTAGLAIFTPGYFVALILGWGSSIASVVFAYLDFRALRSRGVPQPFHWAFSFLVLASAGLVYPIGRSVVVRRRAGGSMAPMYVAIAVFALVIIVSLIWSVVVTAQIMSTFTSYYPTVT